MADLTLFSADLEMLRDRGGVDRFVQGRGGGSLLYSDPLCFLCHYLLGQPRRNASVQQGEVALPTGAEDSDEDSVLGQCLRAELLRGIDLQLPDAAPDLQGLEVLVLIWLGLAFGSEEEDDEVSASALFLTIEFPNLSCSRCLTCDVLDLQIFGGEF